VEQLRADKLLEQGWSINQEYLKEALEKIEKGHEGFMAVQTLLGCGE